MDAVEDVAYEAEGRAKQQVAQLDEENVGFTELRRKIVQQLDKINNTKKLKYFNS